MTTGPMISSNEMNSSRGKGAKRLNVRRKAPTGKSSGNASSESSPVRSIIAGPGSTNQRLGRRRRIGHTRNDAISLALPFTSNPIILDPIWRATGRKRGCKMRYTALAIVVFTGVLGLDNAMLRPIAGSGQVQNQKAFQVNAQRMDIKPKQPMLISANMKGKKVKTMKRPGLYKNKKKRVRGQPLTAQQVIKTKQRALKRCNKFGRHIQKRRMRHIMQLAKMHRRIRALKRWKLKMARAEARLQMSARSLENSIRRETVLLSSVLRISRKVEINSKLGAVKRPIPKPVLRKAAMKASMRNTPKRSSKKIKRLIKTPKVSAAEAESDEHDVRIRDKSIL